MFAALPPSSSVSFLPVPASSRWIALPTSVEPVNAILSTSGLLDERGARAAVAGDDVDDARRQLRLPQDVAEEQRRERRRLGGLEHDGVPGGERGRDLPREHQQREVPRDDLRRHADAGAACGSGTRTRACRPSPRSRRSARRRAAGRRRATRGSACRRSATRARRTRASAPAGSARCGRGTSRARSGAASTTSRSNASRAAFDRRVDVLLARLRDLGERLLASPGRSS